MSEDLVQRLKAAFQRVKLFPEASETGLIDLIALRNLVPDAISEIERLQAQQPNQLRDQTNVGDKP